ncbi:ceramide synthase 5-like isoform X2 [Diabrotica undecimpunctata]|uniref:ceramide synthase 5-like isoform X2 n=1 Tax=Diabrotica undecimpunctata TaxID=50387 RepID=UPI003B633AA8
MEPNHLQIEDQQSNKYHPIVLSVAVAIPFLLVKFVISEFVVKKIAIHFGLNKGNDRRKSSKSLSYERTLIENERKKSSSQNKYSNFDKFCESGDKFVWYIFIWTYGLIMHWNKPWLWDIESCWRDFGNSIALDVWYYGIFLTAYYLEACTLYFVRVRLSWIVTRMYLFPTWILRSGIEDRHGVLRKISLYYYWNGINLVLLCLHTIWTYMILRAAIRTIRTGVAQDDRSDDEDDIKDERKKE